MPQTYRATFILPATRKILDSVKEEQKQSSEWRRLSNKERFCNHMNACPVQTCSQKRHPNAPPSTSYEGLLDGEAIVCLLWQTTSPVIIPHPICNITCYHSSSYMQCSPGALNMVFWIRIFCMGSRSVTKPYTAILVTIWLSDQFLLFTKHKQPFCCKF